MKTNEINIRDPFILFENDTYYMYGTHLKIDGKHVSGFAVYTSTDLENWNDPVLCFNSAQYGLDRKANWAPEVHLYNGKYYMFATFTQENGRHATYSMIADSPMGPFVPHSDGPLTPEEWESLDGTLYINRDGKPYLVFCHEHKQIIDGTMCYAELNADLSKIVGEIVTMFAASSPFYADPPREGKHFITDGPFMYRSKTDELFMIWSTVINEKYAECLLKFTGGEIGMDLEHLPPLITSDGGHGMLFRDKNGLHLTYHMPNWAERERPHFHLVEDLGDTLRVL